MNNTYIQLTITTSPALIEIISDYVGIIFDDAIEIEGNTIIVRSENDISFIEQSIEALDISDVSFFYETKHNEDWIAKYKLSVEPIDIGKFYVHPSWHEAKNDKINIVIDPAMAFGSGHHATTSSCLEMISLYVQNGDKVLDVGCGSGILSIASCKLGATVDLCDTDPLSIDNSRENFELNNCKYNKIWEGSANNTNDKYHIVIANIIVDVLRMIKKDLIDRVENDGYLILSGILNTKEDIILQSFDSLNLQQQILKDEWVTLVYKKGN